MVTCTVSVTGGVTRSRECKVAADWALIPSGINPGDSFRLMFVTSGGRDATSTAIAPYNTHVRTYAARNPYLALFSSTFTALASAWDVHARPNTLSRSGDLGASDPIYWVGGPKIADSYADFYDGSWDYTGQSGQHPRTESGGAIIHQWEVWTGTSPLGANVVNFQLGNNPAGIGKPNTAGKELHAAGEDRPASQSKFLYAMSPVLTVEAVRAPAAPAGLAAHPYSADSVVLVWNKSSDGTITKYQYRRQPKSSSDRGWSDWTDISGSNEDTFLHVVGSLRTNVEYTFEVRAVNSIGNSSVSSAKATPKAVVTCETATATGQECEVAADWPLIPSGLGGGDSFRLMFVTSGGRDATSTAIAPYNTHVQTHAARNPFLHSFSSSFRALASAWDVHARPNTKSRAGDKGASDPIYWVGGPKIADSYADLYDGSWVYTGQSGQWPRTESGGAITHQWEVWTGTSPLGANVPGFQMGNNLVGIGNPNTAGKELHNAGQDRAKAQTKFLYAMSPLLTVQAIPVITSVDITSGPGTTTPMRSGMTSRWNSPSAKPSR